MAYRLDIQDAINRVKSIGNQIDLNEDSQFVKVANALLSMERARLDEAVENTKKTLGDWAGKELDNWWGTILSIDRLPGVESTEEYIGDATYVSRIKRFMEAGNKGISLEAVRQAAEAGSGVPFRVHKAESRVILTPLEYLSPEKKAGAIRAAHRLAPARTRIEIGEGESYGSTPFTNIWSDSAYVGEDPSNVRLNGPDWNSENMIIVSTADKWGIASEGTLGPGSGTPNLLTQGGIWHVPPLGFGGTATLSLGTEEDEVINRIKFTIGQGTWQVQCFINQEEIFVENITSLRWEVFDKTFNFRKGSLVTLRFTNISQDVESLFVKGTYIGSRVNKDNKESWLALGGKEGANARREVLIADTSALLEGREWVSEPQPDPSFEVSIYGQVSGSPQQISSLLIKTRAPGALFRVSYTLDDIDNEDEYPNIDWIDLPKYYRMNNGRVDIDTIKARHIKLTITNLRPMLLKEYHSED